MSGQETGQRAQTEVPYCVLVHKKLGAASDTHGEVGTGAVLKQLTVAEKHRLVKLL